MVIMSSVQIVKPNGDNIISLDEQTIREILCSENVKDRHICVVSVTGDYRQGKSFLLNFFLRYLHLKYSQNKDVSGDWLKLEDSPLQGFGYSHGVQRNTLGIRMWSELFLADTPSGEKVAIILLDTQGAFDNKTTMSECSKIFALSTLISSVQIFNVQRMLKQYDLDHLKMFGSYGSLMSGEDGAPFQELCVLIRDWACAADFPYGYNGGNAYLEQFLQGDVTIQSLFNKVGCFLMPYPGRIVDGSPDFNGNLNDIDDEFKKEVQIFVDSLLAPEKLVLKTINGRKVTAQDFMFYIEEYGNVLKHGDLPETETFFLATVEAQCRVAAKKAFKIYEKNMDVDVKWGPTTYNNDQLYHKHIMNQKKAVEYFAGQKKFEDESVFERHLVDLKHKIDEKFKVYRQLNAERVLKEQREREQREREQRDRAKRNANSAGPSSSSGFMQNIDGETIATGVAVIGAVAAGAFALFSAFGKKNND